VKDKLVLITGANSGIGYTTTLSMAVKGASVVMVCRDKQKGEQARASVIAATGNNTVDLMLCDLSSLNSVRRFAEVFLKKYTKLDVLINNAGGMFDEKYLSEDCYEWTFAVNHLGHFLLTHFLSGALKKAAPSRIINVSSKAHLFGKMVFDDLMFEKRRYSSAAAYAQAKLANVLFTIELNKRLKQDGVTAYSLHPGAVRTNFFNTIPAGWKFVASLLAPLLISPEKGAETSVYLASEPGIEHLSGRYFEKKKPATMNAQAKDPQVASILWMVSAQLTKIN